MQGPFSAETERALLHHLDATVLVTKDSGPAANTRSKIDAALEVGAHVVLIRRPEEGPGEPCRSVSEAVAALAERGAV